MLQQGGRPGSSREKDFKVDRVSETTEAFGFIITHGAEGKVD